MPRGDTLDKVHLGLAVYYACTTLAFAVLSGVWRDSTYDITFRSDFQFNFRLLTAVAVNDAILLLYHLTRWHGDTKMQFLRILTENASLTVMSLIVQYTSGSSDLLLGIAVILLWTWRGETYVACDKAQDIYRTRIGTTLFATVVPFVTFVAAATDASLYKSMIFGFFVAFVVFHSFVSWFDDNDSRVQLAHLITDFAFSAMIAFTSLVMVYKYEDQ